MNDNILNYKNSDPLPIPIGSVAQKDYIKAAIATQLQKKALSDLQLRILIKQEAKQGNYDSAIAFLNQLIDRRPQSAIDYNNRGLMYLKIANYDQALTDFDQAIALNPQLDRAYNNRGNCYAHQGNLSKAIENYEQALDINPYNQKVWINHGITLRELGNYELAIETLELAKIIGDRYLGRIYAERGYTHYLMGDWNYAIADYRRALSYLPKGDRYEQKVMKWLGQVLKPLIS
ncbi:tetratricopeptide repeat protein [Cyanothece sp. BG0011]|uniref:tetratricopeptide repeat protein n=1 Tax=Cyanothece sp. BG0011 TaxID=2082950 RepID=UPI000D1E1E62|nr:tetratricopeptide repeat protein [Cyanothece sp. BG0011]